MSKEALEVCQDPQGRWFRFQIDLTGIIVVEKKGLATHLSSLPFVEAPTALGDVTHGLEDAGEAGWDWWCQTKLLWTINKSFNTLDDFFLQHL